jgi:hypothetical protein
VDQDAEGGVGVAEAAGGFLLGNALDEDGAEGLLRALRGASGLQEEALREGIVHGGRSEC